MQWTRILHEQPGVRGVWRRWSKKAHTGTGWHLHATKDFSTVWITQEFKDVIREMYFQLSVQRYVSWRYHLLCVEITEQIWHNRTKIQTGRSFGQFLVTRDQGKFGCLAADFLTLPISLCHPSSSSLFPPSIFFTAPSLSLDNQIKSLSLVLQPQLLQPLLLTVSGAGWMRAGGWRGGEGG